MRAMISSPVHKSSRKQVWYRYYNKAGTHGSELQYPILKISHENALSKFWDLSSPPTTSYNKN